MGFYPCFHITTTTVTIWTFQTARALIKLRQKCSDRRNSCSLAISLTYRWLELLSFLIRYKGNQYPPIFNTTNRFVPAHAYRLVLIWHSFQKVLERAIGREKQVVKKKDITHLAQVLLSPLKKTELPSAYLTLLKFESARIIKICFLFAQGAPAQCLHEGLMQIQQ